MAQSLAQLSLLVSDYDEAIDYYTKLLDFDLLEDTEVGNDKRWVRVAPKAGSRKHSNGKTDRPTALLLAKASKPEQQQYVGNQTGGRVLLFLSTDDFWSDFERYKKNGIKFVREPQEMPYGMVAVFEDLYGNLWDLVQYS